MVGTSLARNLSPVNKQAAVRDQVLEALALYVVAARYEDLPEHTVLRTKRLYLDAMGCAIGAITAAPARFARAFALESLQPQGGASLIGAPQKVAAEHAAFANAGTVRYLDFNDTYTGQGHPSDMMPAIVAACELQGTGGKDLILGINIAYEVLAALAESYPIRPAGWDQGVLCAAGVAAASAKIFGLDLAQIRHAISLSVTQGLPLRCSRAGELSMWKGYATAHGANNGLFSARIAKHGITGPEGPFEGVDGFNRQVPPVKPIEIGIAREGLFAVDRCNCKYFPAENQGQAPLIQMREVLKWTCVEDIMRIDVDTYWMCWHEIGGGQGDHAEKWDPKTRETADHSLPYLLAAMLVDGDLTLDSFRPERIADPALRPIMQRIHVTENPTYSAAFPAAPRSRITVTLRDGQSRDLFTDYPPGHWRRPLTDAQFFDKFEKLTKNQPDQGLIAEIRDLALGLEELEDLALLTTALGRIDPNFGA